MADVQALKENDLPKDTESRNESAAYFCLEVVPSVSV